MIHFIPMFFIAVSFSGKRAKVAMRTWAECKNAITKIDICNFIKM